MIIIVDIGNTNIHLGVYNNGVIYNKTAIPHIKKTKKHITQSISVWIERIGSLGLINHLALCSVNNPVADTVKNIFKHVPVVNIDTSYDIGININYNPLSSFGADRYANLAALKQKGLFPCGVIDIGSALTFDILNPNGKFAGGIIFPGPALSAKALNSYTDKLPLINIFTPDNKWGHSTEQSINCGIFYGYKGLAKSIINQASECFPSFSFYTVATGGFANHFLRGINEINEVDEDFTLKGIGVLFDTYIKNNTTS